MLEENFEKNDDQLTRKIIFKELELEYFIAQLYPIH